MLHPSDEAIQIAIASTLPTTVGSRHRAIFELARKLKAIQELAGAEVNALKPILRQWHQAAPPVIGTKPFEDTWIDFVEAWPKVKHPAGEVINRLFTLAVTSEHPQGIEPDETPQINVLVRLCRELQCVISHGTEPFHLDVRTAGSLLQVDHTTAHRWLSCYCTTGLLNSFPEAAKRAARRMLPLSL